METHLHIIGTVFILLAFIHTGFPKYFNWKIEFKTLSLINRQMAEIHTFFIAIIVFLMGILCLTSAAEIVATDLGRKLALGLGIFWGVRLFFQFFVYSAELWRGKRFETIVHIIFSILWTYLTVVFLTLYFH